MQDSYTLEIFIALTQEHILVDVHKDHTVQDVVNAIRDYYNKKNIDLDTLASKRVGTKKFNLLFSRKGKVGGLNPGMSENKEKLIESTPKVYEKPELPSES